MLDASSQKALKGLPIDTTAMPLAERRWLSEISLAQQMADAAIGTQQQEGRQDSEALPSGTDAQPPLFGTHSPK